MLLPSWQSWSVTSRCLRQDGGQIPWHQELLLSTSSIISSWHEPHAAFIWNVPDFSCCCLTPHGPCLMDSFLWSFYWPSVDEFLCVNSVPCTQHICIYISGLFTEVGSSYGRNCVLSIFVALAPSIVPTHRRCSINVNLNWTSMSGSEILRPA